MSDGEQRRLDAWIRELAAIARPSASDGERVAADWIVARLQEGGVHARIEAERANGTHVPFLLPSLIALVAGFSRRRRVASAVSALATLMIADEVEGRRRILRRSLARRRTFNVVANLGDPAAQRTIVFSAHHDVARPWAAPFGALAATPAPFLNALPVVALLVYAPLLVFCGTFAASTRLKRAGMALCAFLVGFLCDISRRSPVPGANDNGSAVAAVIALAHDLAADRPTSVRVLLLSTGSEETMLEGMHAFLRRHRSELDPGSTLVVCLDQIGWQRLVVRDSEGVLRRYRSRQQDLGVVLEAARDAGISIEVAAPFPTPSDGLAARWAGLPTVFLSSVAANGGYPNYHRPTDLPEHVELGTVARARQLCRKLVESLDQRAPSDQ